MDQLFFVLDQEMNQSFESLTFFIQCAIYALCIAALTIMVKVDFLDNEAE